jgi:hypothetical protein
VSPITTNKNVFGSEITIKINFSFSPQRMVARESTKKDKMKIVMMGRLFLLLSMGFSYASQSLEAVDTVDKDVSACIDMCRTYVNTRHNVRYTKERYSEGDTMPLWEKGKFKYHAVSELSDSSLLLYYTLMRANEVVDLQPYIKDFNAKIKSCDHEIEWRRRYLSESCSWNEANRNEKTMEQKEKELRRIYSVNHTLEADWLPFYFSPSVDEFNIMSSALFNSSGGIKQLCDLSKLSSSNDELRKLVNHVLTNISKFFPPQDMITRLMDLLSCLDDMELESELEKVFNSENFSELSKIFLEERIFERIRETELESKLLMYAMLLTVDGEWHRKYVNLFCSLSWQYYCFDYREEIIKNGKEVLPVLMKEIGSDEIYSHMKKGIPDHDRWTKVLEIMLNTKAINDGIKKGEYKEDLKKILNKERLADILCYYISKNPEVWSWMVRDDEELKKQMVYNFIAGGDFLYSTELDETVENTDISELLKKISENKQVWSVGNNGISVEGLREIIENKGGLDNLNLTERPMNRLREIIAEEGGPNKLIESVVMRLAKYGHAEDLQKLRNFLPGRVKALLNSDKFNREKTEGIKYLIIWGKLDELEQFKTIPGIEILLNSSEEFDGEIKEVLEMEIPMRGEDLKRLGKIQRKAVVLVEAGEMVPKRKFPICYKIDSRKFQKLLEIVRRAQVLVDAGELDPLIKRRLEEISYDNGNVKNSMKSIPGIMSRMKILLGSDNDECDGEIKCWVKKIVIWCTVDDFREFHDFLPRVQVLLKRGDLNNTISECFPTLMFLGEEQKLEQFKNILSNAGTLLNSEEFSEAMVKGFARPPGQDEALPAD